MVHVPNDLPNKIPTLRHMTENLNLTFFYRASFTFHHSLLAKPFMSLKRDKNGRFLKTLLMQATEGFMGILRFC